MSIRKVYVYSKLRDYAEKDEYIKVFKEKNAKLLKGTEESLTKYIDENLEIMQLDTETNVTDFYTDRDLYVIQLGTYYGEEQHIIDFRDIPRGVYDILNTLFNSDTKFIAHNAKFEYIVIYKFFGVYIKHFKDTMLASKLITAGLEVPSGYNGLANLLKVFFGIDVSKASQTTFTGEMMEPEQLLYANTDVLYLGKLLDALLPVLKRWNLLKCFALENKSLRAIGDLTINGILIDIKALDENIEIFEQNAASNKEAMIDYLINEEDPIIKAGIEALDVVQKEEEVIINWKSHVQKRVILKYLYPDEDIKSSAKNILTKLEDKLDNPKFVTMLLNGNTEGIEEHLISRHMDFLDEHGMIKHKGDLNLNFNSNDQLLSLFKLWYPNLKSVGVTALKKLKKPIINSYKVYSKANKLVTSFGRKIHTFIESDGRIRSDFNQLVPSGSRLSSRRPNMQQAPSTEQYRRMFIPTKNWLLIDTDYASMEIFLAADMSKDVKMLKAISLGYDINKNLLYLHYNYAA